MKNENFNTFNAGDVDRRVMAISGSLSKKSGRGRIPYVNGFPFASTLRTKVSAILRLFFVLIKVG